MAKYFIIGLLLLIFGGLQYRLWFDQSGVQDTLQLKKAIKSQQQNNQQMQLRNQSLIAEVKDLKHGQQAIEEHARSELGMIKQGEQFYQIAEPTSKTHSKLAQ